MPIILLVAIIIIAEQLTHKTLLELAIFLLKKVGGAIGWFILFLLKMDEPRGSKS